MLTRALLLILVFCVACRTNEFTGIREIKCPEFKAKKLKKHHTSVWRIRTPKKADQKASAKGKKPRDQDIFRTKIEHLQTTTDDNFDLKPILHQVNVEEMDCPKPGMGKNLPKAVKQNIRKNNKKIKAYLKKKTEADSVSSSFPANKK